MAKLSLWFLSARSTICCSKAERSTVMLLISVWFRCRDCAVCEIALSKVLFEVLSQKKGFHRFIVYLTRWFSNAESICRIQVQTTSSFHISTGESRISPKFQQFRDKKLTLLSSTHSVQRGSSIFMRCVCCRAFLIARNRVVEEILSLTTCLSTLSIAPRLVSLRL